MSPVEDIVALHPERDHIEGVLVVGQSQQLDHHLSLAIVKTHFSG